MLKRTSDEFIVEEYSEGEQEEENTLEEVHDAEADVAGSEGFGGREDGGDSAEGLGGAGGD